MINLILGGTPPLPSTEAETSCCFLTKMEADSNLGCTKHISKVATTTPKPFGEFIAFSLMLYTMIYQLVSCYGSLTGTSASRSHHEWHLTVWIFSLQEKRPPVGSGACSQKTSMISSWWGTWALSHHRCSSAHLKNILFVQSLAAESELGKAMSWGCMRLHCEKGLFSVTSLED